MKNKKVWMIVIPIVVVILIAGVFLGILIHKNSIKKEAQKSAQEIFALMEEKGSKNLKEQKIAMPNTFLKVEDLLEISFYALPESLSENELIHMLRSEKMDSFAYEKEKLTEEFERLIFDAGYERIGETSEYAVYENDRLDANDWEVISHVDASGNQGIFYTLYNYKEDKLIVVDGGQPENEQNVRDVIASYGNKVDAWFLTHYHMDHASVFNAIAANPNGIDIKQVYAPEYDYDYFKSVAYEWDDFDCYEQSLAVLKDLDCLTYVKREDVISIAGLTINVLNTYDDISVMSTEDIGNDGGLMLKFKGEENGLLMCADVHGHYIGEYLLGCYYSDLVSEYIQLGHHGNNSFSESFYEYLLPHTVIFDSPAWLMEGDEYTAKQLEAYFDGKGVRTMDWRTGDFMFFIR